MNKIKSEKVKRSNATACYADKYIVELYGRTQFIIPWHGDPGRTCVRSSAKKYKSEFAARCALEYAKRNFPNRDYSEATVVKEEL